MRSINRNQVDLVTMHLALQHKLNRANKRFNVIRFEGFMTLAM